MGNSFKPNIISYWVIGAPPVTAIYILSRNPVSPRGGLSNNLFYGLIMVYACCTIKTNPKIEILR